jgi:hypothetical protein
MIQNFPGMCISAFILMDERYCVVAVPHGSQSRRLRQPPLCEAIAPLHGSRPCIAQRVALQPGSMRAPWRVVGSRNDETESNVAPKLKRR